ncbi:hypothetical protein NQ016_03870 [Staphylococcus hyicus]|uniref:hypothetical protein n=1 Tax=Staphylococcus hyicus TaxID=1284 RepID=UPI00211C4ABB|nr:hypothetical protein [Staphylococcus hyicus]MCQ9290655.1 hypothetical protein [Staphylococcus hyicus]MCQ9305897.1 hypothetical protein [Staphylococcus hyicus]MCQ9308309.1 hypothetical protein [Staphylococcus hyicus]MCQ9310731.1 hypothetical protein [Staphylococcus hyicus]
MKVEKIFNGILLTPESQEEREIVKEHKKEIKNDLQNFFDDLIKREGGQSNEVNR